MAYRTDITVTVEDQRLLTRLAKLCRFLPESILVRAQWDRKAEAVELAINWARESGQPTTLPADFADQPRTQLKLHLSRDYTDTYSHAELSAMVHAGLVHFFSSYVPPAPGTYVDYLTDPEEDRLSDEDRLAINSTAFRLGADPRQVRLSWFRQELAEGIHILRSSAPVRPAALPLDPPAKLLLADLMRMAHEQKRDPWDVIREARRSIRRRSGGTVGGLTPDVGGGGK